MKLLIVLLLFCPSTFPKNVFIVNRSNLSIVNSHTLKLRNSNGRTDFTIGSDWYIESYGGSTSVGCTKLQGTNGWTGVYPVKCESLSGCSNCWFPSETTGTSLVVWCKDATNGRKLTRTYTINVLHDCDCSMVGCNSFKDVVTSQGREVSFPVGNTNLKSCHFSKQYAIVDGTTYSSNKISTSSLSGQYSWKIRYSMTRYGVANSWSFDSTSRYLCVLSPPPKAFLSGSGLSRITSTDSSSPTQYLATSAFSFKPQTPSNSCSQFSVSLTSQLNCGSGLITCSQSSSCSFSLRSSSLTCSYSQTLSFDSYSASLTSSHQINFVSFGVGLAQTTQNSDLLDYVVPVSTHSGSLNQNLIKETFSLSLKTCSFSSNSVVLNSGSRCVKFSCPFFGSVPQISLTLSGSGFSSIKSSRLSISSVPIVSDLTIVVNSERIVEVSWSSIGGGSGCSFDLSVTVSGTETVKKTSFTDNQILLSSENGFKIENGDTVTVSVTPKCGTVIGEVLKDSLQVCIPSRPSIVDFDCPSCFKSDTQLASSELQFDITFTLSSSGIVCDHTKQDYVFFDFGDSITTVPFQEASSAYSFTHHFSFNGEFDDQDPSTSIPQTFRLNGFDFTMDSSFRQLSFCIVPPLQGSPINLSNSENFIEMISGVETSFEIEFIGIEGLYSPCFSHGRYRLEFWTIFEKTPRFYEENGSIVEILAPRDNSLDTHLSFTFKTSIPQVYYFRIVGLSGRNEESRSEIGVLSICSTASSISKPILLSPKTEDSAVSVLNPVFSWQLSPETLAIRCSSSETAFLIFELDESENALNKREPDYSADFGLDSNAYSICITLSLFSLRFELSELNLLKLSTNYSWRLTVYHQKSESVEATTITSDVETFLTVSKHCAHMNCNRGICDDSTLECICNAGYRGEFCDASGLSIGAYVGIILGIIVFVGILVAIVIILLIRANYFGLRMPDFTRFMFSAPKVFDDEEESADIELIKEIIMNDPLNDFAWALALFERTAQTEADNICRSMIYAYERNGEGLNLIKKMIEHEVDIATQTTTLFRNNSLSTKCFKVYSRMVGLPYLYRVLYPLLNKLIKEEQRTEAGVQIEGNQELLTKSQIISSSSSSYELNPDLIEETEQEITEGMLETNCYAIQFACQLFLSTLDKTTSFCPIEFRELCNCVRQHVQKKFPDHKLELALSAFMFLRYFVAGLTVPESFGLSKPPSSSLRRQLILISKVLSNLSTNVMFGDKEGYMTILNDFLEQNKDSLSLYYRLLCQPTMSNFTRVTIPEKHYQLSLEVLAQVAIRLAKPKTRAAD